MDPRDASKKGCVWTRQAIVEIVVKLIIDYKDLEQ